MLLVQVISGFWALVSSSEKTEEILEAIQVYFSMHRALKLFQSRHGKWYDVGLFI